MGTITIFLFLYLIWTAACDVPCPYKECTCGATSILCSEHQFNVMPQPISVYNSFYTNADFDINNITRIPSGSLPGNLTSITFLRNPITTIDDDAFDGSADTLTSLFFFEARFIQLPTALGHMRALNFLSISDTTVQDWNLSALEKIGVTVSTLSLVNIVLKEWPAWMQLFTNLTDLDINGCLISSIPDNGLVSQVNTLTDLSLGNNSLKSVPKAVSNLTALQALELNSNKITDVKWLPKKSKLLTLALHGNKLVDAQQLTEAVIVYADTLADLQIQSNRLTSFPGIRNLTLINELDFNHNKLVDPNSGSLPDDLTVLKMEENALPRIPRILSSLRGITQVYLGSNAITEIEGTAFPPFVQGVELQNNLITDLRDTSFPVNSNITYILLTNNPLVRISDNAFVNLPHLVELNLQKTKLTRLPLALASLSQIDDFDITGTAGLICTCQEKNLQGWFRKLGADSVKGFCGVTSIFFFFTVLSSNCP